MSVPREDYVLRLRWTDPGALTSNLLDLLAVSHDETVALVAWEAHSGVAFVQAGFSVIRFTKTGNIRWQSTHTLCGPTAFTNCGQWVLRYGAIAVEGERFIVIGTIVDAANPNVFESIGIGIDDGGAVVWSKRYQTTFSIGRAMGIVPLATPGQFLVASHNANETETWLYGIDRTGTLTGLEMRFFGRFVQRLRALSAQGIFVLGTNNDDPSHPLGWILNIDPTTGKRAWERTYDPHDGTTLRWYDAAEGKGIVTTIGNTGAIGNPFVATLADNGALDAGNVRASFRPDKEKPAIFLNGIANFPTPASMSSICGEFNGAAWHIAIDDSVNILWQKKYNHGGSSASLTPILFPNAGTVVAGGRAMVPGNPQRGLLVQSKAAIGSPAPFGCGEETHAVFAPANLSSEQVKSPFKDLAMRASYWFVNQSPMIEVEEDCLP
jgi:hypothetical protein